MTLSRRLKSLQRRVPAPEPDDDLSALTERDWRIVEMLLAERDPRVRRAFELLCEAWHSVPPARRVGHWWGEIMWSRPEIREAERLTSEWMRRAESAP